MKTNIPPSSTVWPSSVFKSCLTSFMLFMSVSHSFLAVGLTSCISVLQSKPNTAYSFRPYLYIRAPIIWFHLLLHLFSWVFSFLHFFLHISQKSRYSFHFFICFFENIGFTWIQFSINPLNDVVIFWYMMVTFQCLDIQFVILNIYHIVIYCLLNPFPIRGSGECRMYSVINT